MLNPHCLGRNKCGKSSISSAVIFVGWSLSTPTDMAATPPTLFWSAVVLVGALAVCTGTPTEDGHYIITTPRKWTSGEHAQICAFVLGGSTSEDSITVTLRSEDEKEELIPRKIIQIPPGKTDLCEKVFVSSTRHRKAKLKISGILKGKTILHNKDIIFSSSVSKTFVQTDKFLYKPGQEVKFRVLTLNGPFLKISTDRYPLVWVETPSGSRIAQWSNVDNTNGLIHLDFKLSAEPEEGTYKITVRPSDDSDPVTRTFKVEEYVLPRFEVSVKPPNYILGTDTKFNFTVCAKYTYGQPVKGNLTLEVNNQGWGSSKIIKTFEDRITGCKDVEVSAEDIQLNGDDHFVYNVEAKAVVLEDGTGQELKGSTSAEVHRTALQFTSLSREEYIKPNLPFTGKVKAEFPDGTPAGGELMEVCAGGTCKNITTSAEGILEYVVPKYDTRSVTIKSVKYQRIKAPNHSWRSIMYESSHHDSLKKYFSPSNSSLVIHSPEGHLPCHHGEPQEHILPVLFAAVNQTRATVTVQVISRGQIQYSSTQEYDLAPTDLPFDEQHLIEPLTQPDQGVSKGVINLPVRLPSTVSPTAKVIVWYNRPDGELVTDTQKLEIQKCFSNDVNLEWSSQRVQPGETATLNITSEPLSVCSLGVVDKSVELLSSQNDDLTLAKVFEIVEKVMIKEWENAQSDDYEYCRKWNEERKPPAPPSPPELPETPELLPAPQPPRPIPFLPEEQPEELPAEEVFPVAGPALLPAAPAPIVKRSSPWWRPYYSNYVDAIKMFDNSGLYVFTDLTTETRPCEERAAPELEDRFGPTILYDSPPTDIRTKTRPQALPQPAPPSASSGVTSPSISETAEPRTYFPETWLWQLSALPETGVNSQELTLPDTITEWVGKAVCVHPEKGVGVSPRASITTFTPFFIDLTLPPTIKRGEILPVKISVFNYLDQALPVKVVLEESPEYEILGDPAVIVPPGHRSSCIAAQEKVVHTVKIRSLVIGDVNITVGAFVDELYPQECGPEYVISKRDLLIKPIKVEAEGFPREKAWTKYICTKDIEENADFLERWRIETPPAIVEDSARGWVTAVGDLLGPTLENLGSLVRMPYGCGEQNMLNFAPNIFILQYLQGSNQSTPAIANKAIDFMKQGYQRELRYRHDDGSYSAFGNSDASGSTWLTAFVLKSFSQARQFIQIDSNDVSMSQDWLKFRQMENGCFESVGKVLHKGMKGGIQGSESPAPLTAFVLISLLEAGEVSTSKAVSEAAFCLNADKSVDPYTLVLKAYALSLAGLSEAEATVQLMISSAVETSNTMYWELPAGPSKTEAVAVETAGYAILALMTLDAPRFENQARKIVKWISSQRNGQGGFISTQDTVVALQALASFESHQSQDPVNLVVSVSGGTLDHAFFIDESNKLLQQQVTIPQIPSNVILDMEGQGCALVQAVLRYNVPDASPSDAFSLNVSTSTEADKECVTKRIKACAAYHLPDGNSNMAVIEVKLVSGYIPEKADLKQIVGYGTGLFKRYEVDGNKVTFYIDEFSASELCLTFRIIREVDVEDAKPGTVKVYDYYEPELFVSKSYTLPPTDECKREFIPIDYDLIIEEPIVLDYDAEGGEGDAPSPTTTVAPEAIDDLIAALDDLPI